MVTPAKEGVRCPHCNKKVGEYLRGIYVMLCPGCKQLAILDTEVHRPNN